ncbi:MAG: hypothetical protein DRJ35_08265, partial [Thermoprotei archaeon]
MLLFFNVSIEIKIVVLHNNFSMSNIKRSEEILKNVIAPTFLVLASIIILGYPLFRSPLLLMIDGPYYAVQARWILEKGHMKYLDPPLVFYIMAFVSAIVGDIFLGVKITVVVLSSLATLPWYFYFSRKGSWAAGIGAGAAIVCNQWMIRMVPDFMKNATGITWLSAFIVLSLMFLEKGEKKYLAASIVFFVLTALTHILDFAVAIFYSIMLPLIYMATLKRIEWNKMVLPLIGITLVAVAFAAPFVVGGDVYKGLAFLEDISEYEEYSFERLPEALLVAGIAATLVISGVSSSRNDPVSSSLDYASALLIVGLNFPAIPPKWLFRFRNMNLIPLAAAVGSSLSHIKEWKKTLPALVLIVFILLSMTVRVYPMLRPTVTQQQYMELKEVIRYAEERGLSIVILDPKLRYWAETIGDNIYKRVEDAPQPFCFIIKLMSEQ